MSIPRAELGQAWVIVMPVVMVVVRADQMVARGLLVVGDQVFVREPLEGQTQGTCYQSDEGIHLAAAGDRICPPWRSVVLKETGPPWEGGCLSPGSHQQETHLSAHHDAVHLQIHIPPQLQSALCVRSSQPMPRQLIPRTS